MIFKNIDSILQIGFETLLVKNIIYYLKKCNYGMLKSFSVGDEF